MTIHFKTKHRKDNQKKAYVVNTASMIFEYNWVRINISTPAPTPNPTLEIHYSWIVLFVFPLMSPMDQGKLKQKIKHHLIAHSLADGSLSYLQYALMLLY